MVRLNNRIKKLVCFMLLCVTLLSGAAIAEYRIPVEDHELDAVEGLDENVINILLIGTDTLEKDMDGGRADVMMICSVNKKTGALRVASLQRDTWVTIGENGMQNKINAAHSFGGVNLLMQTINRTFGMNIEKYVKVNFYAVCDIVDALGGVKVELEPEEIPSINRGSKEYANVEPEQIPSGTREATLTGSQALAYARIRHLDNDFGRTARQRKLLYAMAKKLSESSIPEMINTATVCFEYVQTNLSLLDMISLATTVMKNGLNDMRMKAFPAEGDYHYGTGGGPSRLIIDNDQVAQTLHEFIYQ